MVIGLGRFGPALLKARFKIEGVCDLILYVPPILGLIGAYFLEFYVILQRVLDFTGERGETRPQDLQIAPRGIAGVSAR